MGKNEHFVIKWEKRMYVWGLHGNKEMAMYKSNIGNKNSLQHLNAVVATVTDNNAALCINQNAARTVKLPIFASFRPDGSNVRAIGIPQNLHPVIFPLRNNDVTSTIKGDADRAVEFTRT